MAAEKGTSMAKPNILLVDDDLQHMRVMEVSLRNAGHAVTTATDGAAALTRAAAVTPDLIIADTTLPVLDGFGLCARLKQDPRLSRVPFLFLSEDDSVESKVRGLELGADDYLTRPIYTRELVARVRTILQKQARLRAEQAPSRRRFFGSLGDMGVVDLIQTMSVGEKSGTVRIDRPGHHATLWFDKGHLIDASTGTQGGADAVYRTLTWETGDFEIDFRAPQRPAVLEPPTAALLMEGMRRVDEWNRICEQLPGLDSVFEVDYEELSDRLAELPDEANALLRMFDGRRTALDVIDDADLPDLVALGLLSRLYFEGIIRVAEDARPRVESAAMSTGSLPEVSAAPSLADALIEQVTGGFPAIADEPAREPRRVMQRPRDLLPPASAATPPPEPEAPSTWGALGEKMTPARVVMAPEPEVSEPEEDDFPALPETDAIADLDHESGFFEHAADAVADAGYADDPLFEDEPLTQPMPRIAWVAIGIFGAAVVGAILFFALRDVVEPMPLPENPRNGGWHREVLAAKAPVGKVPPLGGEWRIPNEPGGGEAPPIPRFDEAATPAAPAAPEEPAGTAPEAPAEAPAAATAPDPAPARVEKAAPTDRAAEAPPKAPAKADDKGEKGPEKAGGDARALIAKGLSLYEKGKYKAAGDALEQGLALSPNNKAGLLAYAKALIEQGRIRDALEAAERASRIDGNDAEVQLILADARQNLGRIPGAIKAYERYLQLAPKGEYAADVTQILKGLRSGLGN